ncbi:MAG TPA: hypothetical protein VJ854_05410 [Sphaerochaeta sp.]|nr:hypothetical protein [Sphaerochaeta sp.]
MKTNAREKTDGEGKELACFPLWFLAMTDSKPLLVVFAIVVLLCAPLLMVFGAVYPLFKH